MSNPNYSFLGEGPAGGAVVIIRQGLTGKRKGCTFNHMVKSFTHRLDQTFSALSDPTRRAIVARLAAGEASVSEVAEPFAMSLPAVSKHLRVLEEAGLLARTKEGRVHRLRLVVESMQEASEWIAAYREFWEGRLDALAEFLEKQQKEDGR